MTVFRESASIDIAEGKAIRPLFRSDAEIAIREVVEDWLRARVVEARIMHEVNMCQGGARVDVLAVGTAVLAGVEIKGPWDNSDRLINQLASFRLALPELWLVAAGRMVAETFEFASYLFPSLGLVEVVHDSFGPAGAAGWCEANYRAAWGGNFAGSRDVDRAMLSLRVHQEATVVAPFDRGLLNVLWVEELRRAAARARVWQGKSATHRPLVEALMVLTTSEKIAAVCEELRCRPTLHRADAPRGPEC
ncbi:hypothetical protein BH10PSE7_BH10PSE7_15320 [soil metagenome]